LFFNDNFFPHFDLFFFIHIYIPKMVIFGLFNNNFFCFLVRIFKGIQH
jgi:hypothetical protein